MRKIGLALSVFLLSCSFGLSETPDGNAYRGTPTDKDSPWPHRYTLVQKADGWEVTVEQRLYDQWFSWGKMKITSTADSTIRFTAPWGVPGKALHMECAITIEPVRKEGFRARLTTQPDLVKNLELSFIAWSPAQQENAFREAKKL